MSDLIITQLLKKFKRMIEEIMIKRCLWCEGERMIKEGGGGTKKLTLLFFEVSEQNKELLDELDGEIV